MARTATFTRSRTLWTVVLAGALVCLAPRSLRAQESTPPTSDASAETVGEQGAESAARAREAFQAGVAHYEAQRYVDAIHEFQVAASLIPSADLWFNIASAYEQLTRTRGELTDYEQAIAHYRRYLTEQVDPPDRAQVEANIGVLTQRLEDARAAQHVTATQGTLRIRSEVAGATVTLDDREVGTTPIENDLTLDPGRHRLEATLEGHLPFLAEVSLDVGTTTTTNVTLLPARTHRASTRSPVFAWVAWGLAVATLGASIGVGVHAEGLIPSDEEFDPSFDQYAEPRTWSAVSDGLLAATAGLATLGIALFVIESSAVGTVTERGGEVEPEP